MTIIYGVDTEKPVTPYDVREAIVTCFVNAHSEALEDLKNYSQGMSPEDFSRMKEINVQQLVRGYFLEVGGNYEEPTKESLIQVMEKLKGFAVHFRNPEIIETHYKEINELVSKLT